MVKKGGGAVVSKSVPQLKESVPPPPPPPPRHPARLMPVGTHPVPEYPPPPPTHIHSHPVPGVHVGPGAELLSLYPPHSQHTSCSDLLTPRPLRPKEQLTWDLTLGRAYVYCSWGLWCSSLNMVYTVRKGIGFPFE